MQNDALEQLSDNELVRRAFLASKRLRQAEDHSYAALAEQSVEELERRLSALRAEVERLKSDKEHLISFADNFAGQVERLTAELSKRPTEGEAVVMRELCEAYVEREDGDYRPGGAQRLKERLDKAEAAYRTMKGGSDAH